MQINKKSAFAGKIPYMTMVLVLFLSAFGAEGSVGVQKALAMPSSQVLSDGQFVYGPNMGDFILKTYLEANAPHLLDHADDLYGRSEYFSINPKIYLTLLEIHAQMISAADSRRMDDIFGFKNGNFISQIEFLSNKMTEAYYLHLYSYSALPASRRNLPPFITPEGNMINVAADTNAATYALIAGLAAMDEKNISEILDNSHPNGFYQTYTRLFANDDPLDEKNHIYIPGEVGALAAPDNLLQLPFLRELSWKFGGVHDTTGGGGVGTPFNDASSLDFYPGGTPWGVDTSNMWVVAAASGVPVRLSACGYKILHSDGWETTYYHLENTQFISGSINQNDKIGVIANTLAEATCTGGAASGPHVHFSLRRNGAYVAINGTALSGWHVNCNGSNGCLTNYDTNPTHMWLEKAGLKKYPFNDVVLSQAPPTPKGACDIIGAGALSAKSESDQANDQLAPKVPVVPVDDVASLLVPANGGNTTGVFRPSNGLLYLKNDNTSGFADVAINYGIAGDCPVAGDWDGNGTATIGIYRNGTFYLRNSNTLGFADLQFSFGTPGDQPIAGDWDNNGTDSIGVFRPTTGQFLLRNSNSAGAADASFFLGNAGDVGIAGDWNGDGMDTTGVFRPSNGVLFMKNTNTSGFADIAINYGVPGDQPVTGDWDGDGVDTIGVYRNGQFLLRNSNTLGFADIVFALGNHADMPISGNWDGLP